MLSKERNRESTDEYFNEKVGSLAVNVGNTYGENRVKLHYAAEHGFVCSFDEVTTCMVHCLIWKYKLSHAQIHVVPYGKYIPE